MYNYSGNDHPNVQWDGSTYSTNNYHIEDVPPTPPVPKKKRGKAAAKAVALVLTCALVGGGAGMGGAALYANLNPSAGAGTTIFQNVDVPSTTVSIRDTDGLTPLSLTEIYESYAGSCVVITALVSTTSNTWFGPMTQQGTSAGSGFIISDNGYIVTNYHVINGASEIKVTLFDGTEYTAAFVGGEEANDVAVLKIDADGLKPVVLGSSDNLMVGETVCTIGNAVGTMSFSLTSGEVSGLGRTITYSDGTVLTGMIQTACTINSGNSGGPLFDSYGRVVGITSAKYSNNGDSTSATIENIGFAIPINDVKSVITDIMEHGYVIRPYMGVLNPTTVSDDYAQAFNWPKGVYVNDVEAGSCAEAAGIRRGDIITKLGDSEVTSVSELTAAKNRFSPGDTTEVTVFRAGETLTLSITFDATENPVETQQDTQADAQPSSQPGQGGGYYYDPFSYFFGH